MFHKDISLIMKPPEPSDTGLATWDKNYITDDQSGPFYDGIEASSRQRAVPKQQAPIPKVDKQMITLCLTTGLAAMVFLVALLLVLVSARSPGILTMSWSVWSQAVAVFYSFLCFMAMKELAVFFLATLDASQYTLGSSLVLLFEFIVLLRVLLFVSRSWPMTLLTIGTLGLYVVGFAAIDVFEMVEHLAIFKKADFFVTASMYILGAAFVVIFVALSTSERELMDWSLKNSENCRAWLRCCCCCFFDPESVNTPAWNEWKKQGGKCDDQLAAITIGYLISQAVESGILRAVPARSVSFNFHVLLLATAALVGLSICFALLTRSSSEGQPNRLASVALNTCLMAAAWCIFHGTEWQYSGGYIGETLGLVPKSFTSSFLVALTLSFIVLFTFVVVCFCSVSYHTSPWSETLLRNFQALVAALGFTLGVSWVTCFIEALPGLAANFPKTQVSPIVPATLFVSVVVLPAWGLYILPHTIVGKTVEGD